MAAVTTSATNASRHRQRRVHRQREFQIALGSETSGGKRNPANPNDYFNTSHDGKNRVDDILLVVLAYFKDDNDGNPGLPPYASGYNPDTDRVLPMGAPHLWSLQGPDGLQRVDDIVNALHQYFHDCA